MKALPHLSVFILLLVSPTIFAQEPKEKETKQKAEKYDLFDNQTTLEITLKTDFKHLLKNKYKDEYQPAKIIFMREDEEVTKEIRVKPRGAFRLKYCNFPPLKLNFKYTKFDNPNIKSLNSLKLVTNCKRQNLFEQYILKEYIIYKMYNLLTDMSFRVRLIKMKYIDTGEKLKPSTKYSFVIEDQDQVAERNSALLIKRENIATAQIEPQRLAMLSVFQYMIGNTDWYVPGLHNIKLIKENNHVMQYPTAVPYDFDYTGFVNTIYAKPDKILNISSVRERVFRGVCLDREYYDLAFEDMLSFKSDFYELINNGEGLTAESKTEMTTYLDEFYAILANQDSFFETIQNNCIGETK
ncbi:hypothetical protein R9C00_29495 [Flammeovirgaceae bacterium SG7u.111]|nr:hypothetical protein [Flammeovirgaceae bacterium SG7u.132]WPO35835.1 hypothetical protein R9C00_29495 [Flammeovirgaceae bacterium SG7u.111]